jgi:hypothetical protein
VSLRRRKHISATIDDLSRQAADGNMPLKTAIHPRASSKVSNQIKHDQRNDVHRKKKTSEHVNKRHKEYDG